MAEVAYIQFFAWERSARELRWTSRVIGKFCVNTDPGMGILSETWAKCWGGCGGGSKEASETIIGRASKNKIQDGTTSTLGSLDSPHLRHPRIGKPACSLYPEISGNILSNFFLSVLKIFSFQKSQSLNSLPPPHWISLLSDDAGK